MKTREALVVRNVPIVWADFGSTLEVNPSQQETSEECMTLESSILSMHALNDEHTNIFKAVVSGNIPTSVAIS